MLKPYEGGGLLECQELTLEFKGACSIMFFTCFKVPWSLEGLSSRGLLLD